MRKELPPEVEAGRVAGEPGVPCGAFRLLCPIIGRHLGVIADDGRDWGKPIRPPSEKMIARVPAEKQAVVRARWAGVTEVRFPPPAWEHVSVSARTTPTWDEMCWVKNLFWPADECVVQFHPAGKDYISDHDACLHLWRVIGVDFPLPPPEAV